MSDRIALVSQLQRLQSHIASFTTKVLVEFEKAAPSILTIYTADSAVLNSKQERPIHRP
jgi:hypothetical protein